MKLSSSRPKRRGAGAVQRGEPAAERLVVAGGGPAARDPLEREEARGAVVADRRDTPGVRSAPASASQARPAASAAYIPAAAPRRCLTNSSRPSASVIRSAPLMSPPATGARRRPRARAAAPRQRRPSGQRRQVRRAGPGRRRRPWSNTSRSRRRRRSTGRAPTGRRSAPGSNARSRRTFAAAAASGARRRRSAGSARPSRARGRSARSRRRRTAARARPWRCPARAASAAARRVRRVADVPGAGARALDLDVVRRGRPRPRGARITASAVGERQMLPRQTKQTRIGRTRRPPRPRRPPPRPSASRDRSSSSSCPARGARPPPRVHQVAHHDRGGDRDDRPDQRGRAEPGPVDVEDALAGVGGAAVARTIPSVIRFGIASTIAPPSKPAARPPRAVAAQGEAAAAAAAGA